ncbi:MAG: hypothetical protein HY875_08465 [Chloroflexi bacterium]|nr:hypothetical protein [Chloroflexota bacterium]
MTLRTLGRIPQAVAPWLLPLVAAACSGGTTPAVVSPGPETTATATVASQAPTATEIPWNPIYGYDPGTPTGIPEVDSVMAAISAGDLEALAALTTSRPVPCTASMAAPTAYRCPAAVAEGTRVDIVFAEFCSGSVAFPLAEVRATLRPLLDGSPRLWGLRELPADLPSKAVGAPRSRYVLFVVNNTDPPAGFTLTLGADGGIHGVGYGRGERPEQLWSSWGTTGTVVLPPPPAPRPR